MIVPSFLVTLKVFVMQRDLAIEPLARQAVVELEDAEPAGILLGGLRAERLAAQHLTWGEVLQFKLEPAQLLRCDIREM